MPCIDTPLRSPIIIYIYFSCGHVVRSGGGEGEAGGEARLELGCYDVVGVDVSQGEGEVVVVVLLERCEVVLVLCGELDLVGLAAHLLDVSGGEAIGLWVEEVGGADVEGPGSLLLDEASPCRPVCNEAVVDVYYCADVGEEELLVLPGDAC